MIRTRQAACADTFYPGDPAVLRRTVEGLLHGAEEPREPLRHHPPRALTLPKAIIAPHAGYRYSGAVAAEAYARLLPFRGTYERVVLVGPAHRVPVRSLAVPSAGEFATPLGAVPVDEAVRDALAALPQVDVRDDAHAAEHALEVHLPFLQVALGSFRLVPIVAGDATPEEVAGALETVWGGSETLVVVSSDLSHYHSAAVARRLDAETARAIERMRVEDLVPERACGAHAIAGLLIVAQRRGLAVRRLDLRNSADTAGMPDHVVGYGAFAAA